MHRFTIALREHTRRWIHTVVFLENLQQAIDQAEQMILDKGIPSHIKIYAGYVNKNSAVFGTVLFEKEIEPVINGKTFRYGLTGRPATITLAK